MGLKPEGMTTKTDLARRPGMRATLAVNLVSDATRRM